MNKWRILGRYFGFPECCIDEFIEYITGEKNPFERETRKLEGTGYIPCVECNKKSVGELIDQIEKSRTYHRPFPEHREEEVMAHVAEMERKL